MKNRNIAIDLLKGVAILAVVLYHLDLMENGYLGVDVFFVISGYFATYSLTRNTQQNILLIGFNFLVDRLLRLLPLVLAAGILSLLFGYYFMLPDDYENLSESVVASNLFSNNILSCITTKNYWDVVNTFKPLMHFWYLGILMEFYMAYTILYVAIVRISKEENVQRNLCMTLALLCDLSLVLCFTPLLSSPQKFYYLPCRFFEMGVGALLALQIKGGDYKLEKWVLSVSTVLIFIILLQGETYNKNGVVVVMSFLTLFVICSSKHFDFEYLKWGGGKMVGINWQDELQHICVASDSVCLL